MTMFKGLLAAVATVGILTLTTSTASAQHYHYGNAYGGHHVLPGGGSSHMIHSHLNRSYNVPTYTPYYNYYRSPAFFGGNYNYGSPYGYNFGPYNYGLYNNGIFNNGFGYGYNRGFSIGFYR